MGTPYEDPHLPPEDARRRSFQQAAPGLARIAVTAWWRSAEWTVGKSLRAGSRVLRAAANGESPARLIEEAGGDARQYARRLLGLADDGAAPEDAGEAHRRSTDRLREEGAELLRRSADIGFDDEMHPAYERILGDLAPDEGRILRLLALEGPQPAVDVRTSGPLSVIRSELVAPGLSMIGAQAGCRHPDRIQPYMDNLNRLGLIWFSREPLDDVQRYLVLEAQPEVAEAMRRAGRGRTVRRSIHLTPFGHDFCRTCLPLETAELDALAETDAAPETT